MVKELVVISGKGGTGKTSISASFAFLGKGAVIADCDVDAADMHLLLEPEIIEEEEFEGGRAAGINNKQCTACGKCLELCRFDAVKFENETYSINEIKCEGCGVCAWFCPAQAIDMRRKIAGSWYVSATRNGILVHAALNIAEDNSGKLVSKVREKAREQAALKGAPLVIVDGSPGIGCPVIASITGAALVLIVTEPTVSGLHDLKRVAELLRHFRIKGLVCVNKYDLNPDMAREIEEYCSGAGIMTAGRILYEKDFTKAQIHGKSIVEFSDSPASGQIRKMWEIIRKELKI